VPYLFTSEHPKEELFHTHACTPTQYLAQNKPLLNTTNNLLQIVFVFKEYTQGRGKPHSGNKITKEGKSAKMSMVEKSGKGLQMRELDRLR
jgi:hypothetical protein